MIYLETHSSVETEMLGEILAGFLKRGMVMAFTGDLATGKTTMIKGICRALNVAQQVESPSYTLVNEYQGEIPVYHLDCYREHRLEEWLGLGVNDYFYSDGITLVEWADTIDELIPETAIRINIEHNLDKDNCRKINIRLDELGEESLKAQIRTRMN